MSSPSLHSHHTISIGGALSILGHQTSSRNHLHHHHPSYCRPHHKPKKKKKPNPQTTNPKAQKIKYKQTNKQTNKPAHLKPPPPHNYSPTPPSSSPSSPNFSSSFLDDSKINRRTLTICLAFAKYAAKILSRKITTTTTTAAAAA